MNTKRALILLGGGWHDFDGFAAALRELLGPAGWETLPTYDLDTLMRLEREKVDLVLSYTCFASRKELPDYAGPEGMSDAQIDALTKWVRGGGGFLAAHAATVPGTSGPEWSALIGGVFVEHPPEFSFEICPVYGDHPITAGIEAMTIHDEMYIERYDPSVAIHMLTVHQGVAHPMVWSRTEGRGRVAHVAPGHSAQVWGHPSYRRLMLQAAGWLIGENGRWNDRR